jgi:DNA-3-methyladenine glycosylase I
MSQTPAPQRCTWAVTPLSVAYHDREWGAPIHDDHALFELLVLEGAQAGLSWETILKKREAYRVAFDGFDPARVAAYDEQKVAGLLANPGIIRNRRKILSAIHNASAFLKVQADYGSFDAYLWGFVDGKTVQNAWERLDQIPARTGLSDRLSQDLVRRGFSFAGSTICYALIQSAGLVNDHTIDCFRYVELREAASPPRAGEHS